MRANAPEAVVKTREEMTMSNDTKTPSPEQRKARSHAAFERVTDAANRILDYALQIERHQLKSKFYTNYTDRLGKAYELLNHVGTAFEDTAADIAFLARNEDGTTGLEMLASLPLISLEQKDPLAEPFPPLVAWTHDDLDRAKGYADETRKDLAHMLKVQRLLTETINAYNTFDHLWVDLTEDPTLSVWFADPVTVRRAQKIDIALESALADVASNVASYIGLAQSRGETAADVPHDTASVPPAARRGFTCINSERAISKDGHQLRIGDTIINSQTNDDGGTIVGIGDNAILFQDVNGNCGVTNADDAVIVRTVDGKPRPKTGQSYDERMAEHRKREAERYARARFIVEGRNFRPAKDTVNSVDLQTAERMTGQGTGYLVAQWEAAFGKVPEADIESAPPPSLDIDGKPLNVGDMVEDTCNDTGGVVVHAAGSAVIFRDDRKTPPDFVGMASYQVRVIPPGGKIGPEPTTVKKPRKRRATVDA